MQQTPKQLVHQLYGPEAASRMSDPGSLKEVLPAILAPVAGEDALSDKSFNGHLDRRFMHFDPKKVRRDLSLI